MEHNYCLNCNETTERNFCSNCGQKNEIHRITLKHFLFHDVIHGVWHLEKGILFTLKETIIRPGQAALDYINGKRIKYYNVFYLSLLVIGLNVILLHLKDTHIEGVAETVKNTQNKLNEFVSKYSKIILFCIVPIFSLNAKLIFKRLKLNIAEHFILGGITLLGLLVISAILFLFSYLSFALDSDIFGFGKIVFFLLLLLFPAWSYFNATKNLYTFWGFLYRIICFYLLTFVEFLLIIAFISVVVLKKYYGGDFDVDL